jgi:crotonobetainyl-CoA:carnitine CoA-transferase CaiB-like acyl-CoA transferase
MFRAVNHDKERRTLDLKLEHDRAEFYGLLDSTDILISNWRPGVAVSFGLEPDVVRQRWPRLVWVRMSGYGQDGPLAHEPAFDAIIQARTGTLFAGEEMSLPPMYLADKVTAMMAAQAALAAMLQRSRTGRGSVVDVAMLDSLAYFNGPDLLAGHQRIGRHDDRVSRQLRASRPLTTNDGALMLCPVSGVQLKRTLAAVGLEHQAAELKSAPDTTTMMERLYELVEPRLRDGSTAAQVEALRAADVPVTAVMSVEEHLHDPQIVHNETYRTVDDPQLGPTRVLRYPARFDADVVST